MQTKAIRTATASERPSVGPGRARDNEPARIPYGLLASMRYRLTETLGANQHAQGRDRTNVCMCHLDHLLQLPWAQIQRVPPTEAARLENDIPDIEAIAAGREISRPSSRREPDSLRHPPEKGRRAREPDRGASQVTEFASRVALPGTLARY